MSEEIYRLWLSTVYGIGSRKQNLLLEQFESARSVFHAPVEMLRRTPGITDHAVQLITENRNINYVETLIQDMEKQRIVYISREHGHFPALLREIPDPPVGIFYIGELPDEAVPKVALIGSRRCTEYGLAMATKLSKPLAQHNVVVVSGMARGIDSMAHKGVLSEGGRTIAVLGCGVDVCYPAENRALREDIIRNGCVLSEYPPGVRPLPAYFPARNRIISGLSQVIVVVEAARRSGTFITVDQALDQGRQVMSVPGSALNKLSEGTNTLIREGAAPAIDHEDILMQLGLTRLLFNPNLNSNLSPDYNSNLNPEQPVNTGRTLAPDEKLVYDSLTFEPITFDELLLKTNSQPHALTYICTLLEIHGFIKKLPGQRFMRGI